MPALTTSSPLSSFRARWRELQAEPGTLRSISIAVTASFTVEPLLPYLGCFLADRGLIPRFVVAPFNQIYQSLLDPSGPVRQSAADVTVVLPRLEDLCQPALERLAHLTPDDVAAGHEQVSLEIDRLSEALGEFSRSRASILICGTLPPPRTTPLGLLDATHPASQSQLLGEANIRLWRHAQGIPSLKLFDLASVVTAHGSERAYDARTWHLSRCPFSEPLLRLAGQTLARLIAAMFLAPAKVIALDLDNTLWGGVVGEDGFSQLQLADSGVGAAYVAFQEMLLALRAQGVLLCLASKNNEDDAFEVIDKHPSMRIRREHLAAWRVNWRPKVESLRELAEELGLGLDAFVFVDDSPAERDAVSQLLPEVTVVALPDDPADFPDALRSLPALDRASLTSEDFARADRYAQERTRPAPPTDSASLAAYLASLELRIVVRPLTSVDVPRAAQLTQKTNQFNLTTIRRSEADVEALRAADLWRLYVIEVSDRFGDYGLTGLLFLAPEPAGTMSIDTLLLSCRVLGRGVETAFLAAALRELRQAGVQRLRAHLVPTERNQPVRTFLPDHGFREVSPGEYILEPLEAARGDATHIAVRFLASTPPEVPR